MHAVAKKVVDEATKRRLRAARMFLAGKGPAEAAILIVRAQTHEKARSHGPQSLIGRFRDAKLDT
jgi:hypothetical protein